jgi:hypothetical protein
VRDNLQSVFGISTESGPDLLGKGKVELKKKTCITGGRMYREQGACVEQNLKGVLKTGC